MPGNSSGVNEWVILQQQDFVPAFEHRLEKNGVVVEFGEVGFLDFQEFGTCGDVEEKGRERYWELFKSIGIKRGKQLGGNLKRYGKGTEQVFLTQLVGSGWVIGFCELTKHLDGPYVSRRAINWTIAFVDILTKVCDIPRIYGRHRLSVD